jgi:hypothetical protein
MVHVMMVIVAHVVVIGQIQTGIIHVTICVVALACSQYDQA